MNAYDTIQKAGPKDDTKSLASATTIPCPGSYGKFLWGIKRNSFGYFCPTNHYMESMKI